MSKTYVVQQLQYPVEQDLLLPGSKSHANRAIVCACLASGTTIIRNATPCDDVLVMVENLKMMGFDIEWVDREMGELKIAGGKRHRPTTEVVLDCHNAGTALRFLVSVAALIPGEWVLTGDEHMQRRPIGDLVSALRSLGAEITDTNGCPPIRIRGGNLLGDSVSLKASISSQYLTSLLLIAPLLPKGLTIALDGPLASQSYIDLTEKVVKDFGLKVERKLNTFFVQRGEYVPPNSPHPLTPSSDSGQGGARALSDYGHSSLQNLERGVPQDGVRAVYDIEGDWSAAGAWLVLNELTASRIRFTNLRSDSLQADRRMPEMIAKLRTRGNVTIDCSSVPDQVMNLSLLAAFRDGKTSMTGIANLRHKECDRLAVITSEFNKVRIKIVENEDGLVIEGNSQFSILNSQLLDPHGDHRMAMCFAILGLKMGNIGVSDADCVSKSYPQFFAHVELVASLPRPIAIVGMRGAGKSSLARRLASKLQLQCIDTDRVFEDQFGPIKEYIASNGWESFRTKEEEVVAASLKRATVVSLGGGATESKKTRALLKQCAIVIWIQAAKAELIKRLQSGKRPSMTDLPLHEEVHKLLVDRAPNYKEVASIAIPPEIPYSKQVPFAVASLRSLVHPLL